MSADVLRRAAGLMRERAEAATRTRWLVPRGGTGIDAGEYDTVVGRGPVDCMAYCYGGTSTIEGDRLEQDQAHIAGMDPTVALAVADWLDRTAERHTEVTWSEEDPDSGLPDPTKPLSPFCSSCTEDEYVDAIEYGDIIDQGSPVVSWPCPDAESALTVACAYLRDQS